MQVRQSLSLEPGGPSNRQTPRSRACDACRLAKARCILGREESSCKRCQKHGKTCIVPLARKPRIRVAERFATLEEQIQKLGTALKAQNPVSGLGLSASCRDSTTVNGGSPDHRRTSTDNSPQLDAPTIRLLINHWNMNMQPHFPYIGTVDVSMFSDRTVPVPILPLLVLCVASVAILPAISESLTKSANEELVRRVYLREEQSTDLVLALLLHSQFLAYHDKSVKFKFSPHIHTASEMAIDINLGRRAHDPGSEDGYNAARAWLASYCIISSSMFILNRQRLSNEEIEPDSIMNSLTEKKYNTVTDKSLCELVKVYQILNESSKITSDNCQPTWDNADVIVQVANLSQRLDKWFYKISEHGFTDRLDSTAEPLLYHIAKLYIHRVAIVDFRLRFISLSKQQQPNSSTRDHEQTFSSDHISMLKSLLSKLSADHTNALTACLGSGRQILHHFVCLPLPAARSLPISYYHWILFTIVCLLKLAPLAEDQQRLIPGSVVGEDTMSDTPSAPAAQLQLYTDKLEEICQEGYVPQLKIFVKVFRILKLYYVRRKEVCMNDKVEGCDHTAGQYNRTALNVLRDDLNSADQISSDNTDAVSPMFSSYDEPDHLIPNLDGIIDDYTVASDLENYVERIDQFFEQDGDKQWLEFLDWDWADGVSS